MDIKVDAAECDSREQMQKKRNGTVSFLQKDHSITTYCFSIHIIFLPDKRVIRDEITVSNRTEQQL